jgi:hypothetical protein
MTESPEIRISVAASGGAAVLRLVMAETNATAATTPRLNEKTSRLNPSHDR